MESAASRRPSEAPAFGRLRIILWILLLAAAWEFVAPGPGRFFLLASGRGRVLGGGRSGAICRKTTLRRSFGSKDRVLPIQQVLSPSGNNRSTAAWSSPTFGLIWLRHWPDSFRPPHSPP